MTLSASYRGNSGGIKSGKIFRINRRVALCRGNPTETLYMPSPSPRVNKGDFGNPNHPKLGPCDYHMMVIGS